MSMTETRWLRPHPPEFERFLHASVGEDRKGYAVSVLSALARLDLDPWNETANLVAVGRDGARSRLGFLLSRFRDVPSLEQNHAMIARKLSLLLPERKQNHGFSQSARAIASGYPPVSGAVWMMLAIVFVLFQWFSAGGFGTGE
jgi:hypothetical protein